MEALGMNTRRAKQATRATQAKARQMEQSADPTQANYPPDQSKRQGRS